MPELKDFAHWIPTPILAVGFWWLLKRMFKDFEEKLGSLFGQLKDALSQQQEHDSRIRELQKDVDFLNQLAKVKSKRRP